VDEITTEYNDSYNSGDDPVRAAVPSKPFVKNALVVLNKHAAGHVRS
jgi:hypothetical protein